MVMTRSAVRICPAAPKTDYPIGIIRFLYLSRIRTADLRAEGAFQSMQRMLAAKQQASGSSNLPSSSKTDYPIGIIRFLYLSRIRTADLRAEGAFQSMQRMLAAKQQASGSSNLPSSSKNGLSHRDDPFFVSLSYSNCRPPRRRRIGLRNEPCFRQ